jgi:redox-sensitive bicupin YhaK (pirin superfamily)
MSWNPSLDPGCPDDVGIDAIETLIVPRARDIGGFEVRRALPAPKRQMVGPFIFFDQAGPAEFLTGQGVDVRPHPHIGLGTVTYLYRGAFHHRDSTGADQIIEPGALNWMIAGRGVTHSERTPEAARQGKSSLFGIQTWVALPDDHEDDAPSFEHHGSASLPEIKDAGITRGSSSARPTARRRRRRCTPRRSISTSCSRRARASRCRTTTRTGASTSPRARWRSQANASRRAA